MRTGRPKNAELTVSSAEHAELERLIRARTTPQAVAFRARVVLLCASGEPNSAVLGADFLGFVGRLEQAILVLPASKRVRGTRVPTPRPRSKSKP